ncbi:MULTISPECIES: hypothetical protein [unclassified Streptomyces]|uniref:hypothetical protein n=1 Tax=unclassified Streptomyces TaxID=2593676 RepID=UPI00073CEB75|nr:hypothetical protein [Streptomyces sp. AVP053U2]ODA73381.1 hypothetical protein APS67_002283 [Streptomyces sp. AVP053U2]
MSGTLTLGGLAVALRALRMLALDFGHLPAADVRLSPIDPGQVELLLYSVTPDGDSGVSFAAFEAWRAALGIAPDAVTFRVQGGGRTRVLHAGCAFGGARVDLIAFADAPQTADTPAGGAA